MKRELFSGFLVISLLISMVGLAFNIHPVRAGTIIVPDNYPTIQQAVNAASPGDTIIVKSGTYTENVKVSKNNLAIRSESGAAVTIVQAANASDAIFHVDADYVSIRGFTIRYSVMYAVFLGGSYLDNVEHCSISNNIISHNADGIYASYSSNNILSENTFVDNHGGGALMLSNSQNNTLNGNVISSGFYGICLGSSPSNILTHNVMTGNRWNLALEGFFLSDFLQSIDISNIINGKPAQYLVNRKNLVVDSSWDVGYLGIVNCTNLTVRDLTLSHNGEGILVAYSTNSDFEGIQVPDNIFGIRMLFSSNNNLTSNVASNNMIGGLYLDYFSNNNILADNTASGSFGGIFVDGSSNNTIARNRLINNTLVWGEACGIQIINGAHDNAVYLNNFINNTINAYCDERTGVNDNSWCSPVQVAYTYQGMTCTNFLGNYWNDYTDVDLYSGPYQDEAGSDGIWDHPYIIDADNQDNYPLVNPWTPTPPAPNFSIVASPTSLPIQHGSSGSSTITITSTNVFNQPVQLTVSGAPAGATATLNPVQVTPPSDGSTASTLTVSVSSAATPGNCNLTVTGTSGALTHAVNVTLQIATSPPTNQPPLALFDFYMQKPIINEQVSFDASTSHDSDGHIVSYEWDFDDGSPPTTVSMATITHTFSNSRHYNVVLTVTDDRGAKDSTSQTVKVKEKWSFPIITDTHIGISNIDNQYPDYDGTGYDDNGVGQDYVFTWRLERVVQRIIDLDNSESTDFYVRFVVVLGDITDSAENSEFLKAMQILGRLNDYDIPYVPIMGNHDVWPYTQKTSFSVGPLLYPIPNWWDNRFAAQEASGASGEYFESFFWNEAINSRNIALIKGLFGTSWKSQEPPTSPAHLQNLAFAYKGIGFIGLDCVTRNRFIDGIAGVGPDAELFSDTLNWLDQSLASFPQTSRTVIFSHHPLKVDYSQAFSNLELLKITASLEVFDRSNVLNFAGHLHKNEVTFEGDLLTAVTTEAVYKSTQDIIRIVKVDGDGIDYSSEIEGVMPDNAQMDYERLITANLGSPGELTVYDSEGRVTGLVNGVVISDIPGSTYSGGIVFLTNVSESYAYKVVGTNSGPYDLAVITTINGLREAFTAHGIPTTANAVHQYTINWDALPRGENGVTVQVDSNGDSVFEHTFTSDGELTQSEYVIATESAGVHDVAVTSVTVPFSSAYRGWVVNITVTVANLGNATENFTTTLDYDGNTVGVQPVMNLAPNATMTLLFSWNATDVPYSYVQNYTVTAMASTVPDETDTSNNLLSGGQIQIRMMGDANGDGLVNMKDVALSVAAFNSWPGRARWNYLCDLDLNGLVNMRDIVIMVMNFKHS